MADIVKRIPFEISSFGSLGGGGSYSLENYQFDYALGGIPFLSATRDDWPYSEGMAEIRKQQFDSFAEPGEQSLYGWWLRSQSNFSYGAGILYQDPDNDNQFNFRFADSLGVDTWTSGQVGLLKVPAQKFTLSSTVAKVRGYVDGSGVDAAFYTDGNSLWKITDSGRTAASNPTAGTTLDFANTGTRTLILATDGIWSGIDTAAATKMYSPPAGTLTTGAIEFVKGRIAYAYNNSIYLAPIATTGLPVATPAATYTHSDPNWVWTSITEGPTAIYAAGRNSTTSAIIKLTIDFNGTTEVVLPTTTATTPSGETINTIFGYVGTFMGIATTKGFRVGEFDGNGDVVYGPLLFQPTGGCTGITGFDRFMYVGSVTAHDGASGLFRVDLGTQVQEQTTRAVRYAYGRDIYATAVTNAVAGVSTLGASGRLIFTLRSHSIWLQSATDLYTTGYLKTGRIRFNTEEPKLYKFFSLRSPSPLAGNLQVDVINQLDAVAQSITFTPTFGPATGDVAIAQPQGPQNYVSLKFTLNRGSDVTQGAILNGWQMKALPGSIRQRMINHTFLLFDEEMDKGGQRVGTDGYARERFEAFKALARAGDVVTFQELYEGISTLVVIDDWKLTQGSPPGPGGGTLGGYLTVVLRTVAEST
ncbi:MAG TPA: hypothetical protein VIY48_15535 [Candidatus Paceibacterota bacterium]